MKVVIRMESFEQMSARTLERAGKLARKESVEPELGIGFSSMEDLFQCLTPERMRLCTAARCRPRSVTELASDLGRPRSAVSRDVNRLAELGLLRLRREINPGHGQKAVVEAVAEEFELRASF